MKALQYNQYGGPEILQWVDVPIPTPNKHEVVVDVKAATINPTDNKMRAGDMKMMTALKSFPMGMGIDFAGIVTAIGTDVTAFKPGDEVMGVINDSNGHSFADFTVANSKNVYQKPTGFSFEEAACLPMNAGTALSAVNDFVKPVPGLSILINGAAGGIGLFALQLCKLKGAIVAGTCSADSITALKNLGADESIDYRKTDIYAAGKQYDVILDMTGKMEFDRAKGILNEHGYFCTMTPDLESIMNQVGSLFGSKKEKNVLALPTPKGMEEVRSLIESGQLKAVVGQVFHMSQAIDILQQFETGSLKVTGKVVLLKD